jgi:branched-chain amino acid transport system ATP-binding protein
MRKKAEKILEDLGLSAYKFAYPLGLPYGILKKIELARTLMANPKLIILDEPAAGLNEAETKDLAEVIKKIRSEYEATIFLVEHDMGLVMSICDTVCAISFGKKLAMGTPKEIQNNKTVQQAYLGGE